MALDLLPFTLLVLAVFSAYWRSGPKLFGLRIQLWAIFIFTACISALLIGLVHPFASLLLIILAVSVYYYGRLRVKWLNESFYAIALIISFIFISMRLPGFERVSVYENQVFGINLHGQSLRLYFEKAFAGVLLFCALAQHRSSLSDWKKALLAAKKIPIFMIAFFVLGWALWYIPDPKLDRHVVEHVLADLFFVCLVEEAFFRLMVQTRLEKFFGQGDAESMYLAAVVTTVLFSVSYYIRNVAIEQAVLIFVAGLIYAYAFGRTRMIEISIGTHFLVNAILIIGFLYS